MFVDNRQQFVLLDGDKLVDGLITVISHKERVMNVFHNSVQVDGLDIYSVACSLYGINWALIQSTGAGRQGNDQGNRGLQHGCPVQWWYM